MPAVGGRPDAPAVPGRSMRLAPPVLVPTFSPASPAVLPISSPAAPAVVELEASPPWLPLPAGIDPAHQVYKPRHDNQARKASSAQLNRLHQTAMNAAACHASSVTHLHEEWV
jgi:hypothetical protein